MCKIEHKDYKIKYTENTQNFLKTRTNAYLNNIVKLKNRNIRSDLFTLYLVKHFKNCSTIKAKDIRDKIKVKILKYLNSIDIRKKFGILDCQLYLEEKI